MSDIEAIKKAIRHFECMRNDAVVVLDSGFGTHPGESDLVYRNRKMYAELAINALEKQIPKKPVNITKVKDGNEYVGLIGKCPCCSDIVDESNIVCDCCQKLDWSAEE